MEIVDIQNMPDYNPEIKNGIDSVSTGLVFLRLSFSNWKMYPQCIRHGSLLKVSKDGIWRCGDLYCSNGCYQINKL